MTGREGLRCTAVWDGVRCQRRAARFYSLEDPPYYEGLCDPCGKRSQPRGRERPAGEEITEDEAVVRSVMEDGRRTG